MDRLEIKAAFTVDDLGTVTGLASVFGSADLGGDIVHKGAFAGAQPPIPMLTSHDDAQAVGVWDSLVETAEGLQVKGRLLINDVVRAAEVRALIIAGAMRGLSIGYVATKASKRPGGRDLFKVDLKEISVVAVPMHPGARIQSAKALDAGKVTMELSAEQQAAMDAQIAAAVATAVAAQETKAAAFEAAITKVVAKLQRGGGEGGESEEPTVERKAFRAYLQRGNLTPEVELKALMISSDPNGGYLATPEYSGEVIKDIVEISVIYPTRKPGGNATWDDDTTPEPETSVTNIFGQLEILTKGMSTFVDIPNSMLQDVPMVEAEIREMTAEDFEKKETYAFTNGGGFYDPEGILTNSEIPVWNYGAAAFAASDAIAPLVTMLYSIPPSYRNKGVWMMNGTTMGKMRNWVDGMGLKIWQPSVQLGQPELLLGRPVVENIDMPDVAAGTTPILYGDFSGYRIVDRLSLSVLVDPYSQATAKRTRYHMGRRVGGRVLQGIKFKKLKMV
jgi:HK97 family phage major capsid protein/HK97 family phage prohead protease